MGVGLAMFPISKAYADEYNCSQKRDAIKKSIIKMNIAGKFASKYRGIGPIVGNEAEKIRKLREEYNKNCGNNNNSNEKDDYSNLEFLEK